MNTRIEKDSVGSLEIPSEAYYGVHSRRAQLNFGITLQRQNDDFIRSLVEIKKATAIANHLEGTMPEDICDAIKSACDYILEGNLFDEFIPDPIQGGAGTSANMNANEVIANKAIEIMGHKKGEYQYVHPNDHVNMCQSTNDVYPTAGKLTAIKLIDRTLSQLENLVKSFEKKAKEFDDVIKMGRTQLQDAVPVTLGSEFNAYATAIKRDIRRIGIVKEDLKVINMGATAIGTAINTTQGYYDNIIQTLSEITGIDLKRSPDMLDGTQNVDVFVYVSGALKSCAVNMSKISNDLRLMSSGPKTGLREINLPPRQNGSSIMPGKVNPVIPEVVSQVAFNIIGNDVAISMAAEGGQLELNAFEPVIFYNLFESIITLGRAADTLAYNCVDGITANKQICHDYVENSVGTITALCPHIGYVKAADIAKKVLASGKTVRQYLKDEKIMTEEEIEKVLKPEALVHPIKQ